jgi:flavin-dependent dehydrogenase
MLDADVLIVGAGPAGSATALGLLAAGCKQVVMVDHAAARPLAAGESATPDVSAMLGALGLETDLSRLGHAPCQGTVSLWGQSEPAFDYFLARGRGHGWHLERQQFDDWLRSEAQQRGATLLRPARLMACEAVESGWRVTVGSRPDGTLTEVRARMLVDAGGRRAPLATQLGAQLHEMDGLVALAVLTDSAPALAGLSLVESFAHGWWYAAGLPGGQTMVMLMTDRDLAKALNFHDPAVYMDAWRSTRRLAAMVAPTHASAIHAFAAHSAFLDRAAGPGWLAVGDALLAMDPLTSSGIAGALSDARAAVAAIVAPRAADDAPSRGYAGRANQNLARYVGGLRHHYSRERRWMSSPFWARRQINQEE